MDYYNYLTNINNSFTHLFSYCNNDNSFYVPFSIKTSTDIYGLIIFNQIIEIMHLDDTSLSSILVKETLDSIIHVNTMEYCKNNNILHPNFFYDSFVNFIREESSKRMKM